MIDCPGCYKTFSGSRLRFCGKCAGLLFNGRPVSPELPFSLTDLPSEYQQQFIETIKRTSISGAQFKASMRLAGTTLELSKETGELEYILKPPPRGFDLQNMEAVPANEHLTRLQGANDLRRGAAQEIGFATLGTVERDDQRERMMVE